MRLAHPHPNPRAGLAKGAGSCGVWARGQGGGGRGILSMQMWHESMSEKGTWLPEPHSEGSPAKSHRSLPSWAQAHALTPVPEGDGTSTGSTRGCLSRSPAPCLRRPSRAATVEVTVGLGSALPSHGHIRSEQQNPPRITQQPTEHRNVAFPVCSWNVP